MADTAILSSPRALTMKRALAIVHAIAGLMVFGTACQQVEQGYWTKVGMSQSQFNAEYRRDFQECAHQALGREPIDDSGPETDIIRARHVSGAKTGTNRFNDCMHGHGYQWITMQPLVGPNAHGSTVYDTPCPKDRIVVDPYGYPHCASQSVAGQPARSIDVPREASLPVGIPEQTKPSTAVLPDQAPAREQIPEPSPRKPAEAPPAKPAEIAPETRTMNAAREGGSRRSFDESLCIQHSQASLSNPYETFLRCMEEKGWPTTGQR
jgi:hypothetical protein